MKDKEKKICMVVKAFLENPSYTNEELAALTGGIIIKCSKIFE